MLWVARPAVTCDNHRVANRAFTSRPRVVSGFGKFRCGPKRLAAALIPKLHCDCFPRALPCDKPTVHGRPGSHKSHLCRCGVPTAPGRGRSSTAEEASSGTTRRCGAQPSEAWQTISRTRARMKNKDSGEESETRWGGQEGVESVACTAADAPLGAVACVLGY